MKLQKIGAKTRIDTIQAVPTAKLGAHIEPLRSTTVCGKCLSILNVMQID
jgi:hypothetical protein